MQKMGMPVMELQVFSKVGIQKMGIQRMGMPKMVTQTVGMQYLRKTANQMGKST